jgi:WXG100 family type VII secretion target
MRLSGRRERVVTGFRVDPATLQACDSALDAAVAQAHVMLAELLACGDGLLSERWHGCAAAGFHAAWSEWTDGARRMLSALDALAALVGRAGGSYVGRDEAVRVDLARAAT